MNPFLSILSTQLLVPIAHLDMLPAQAEHIPEENQLPAGDTGQYTALDSCEPSALTDSFQITDHLQSGQ